MGIKHKKEFGVYHYDTFDYQTFLVEEFDDLKSAQQFVEEDHYKNSISPQGADRVDIVNAKGNIVKQYSVC